MEFSSASSAADAREKFVFVEEDGSIREINLEEADYLATAFQPGGWWATLHQERL